jgi:isopropylmalate/homocitrate/citramalate synthase
MSEVRQIPSFGRQPIHFTSVDLRDGEQQEKAEAIMPIGDRIRIFDHIVDTGIKRIEIGHLGNEHDAEFARALVQYITQESDRGDESYDDVELQVLFGSQLELTGGIDALEGFDPDRVVVHLYDRVSPALRNLAATPYTIGDSAARVAEAAKSVIEKGYRNISISGEGTVDPDVSAEAAAQNFYIPIIQAIKRAGAAKINVNLPNTFGSSLGGEWNKFGLKNFDALIKHRFPDVTTSIHVHNDHNSATEVALTAIEAGFDTVEGTLFGMGERSGNVALADVMVRLLEDARQVVEVQQRWDLVSQIAQEAVMTSVWVDRALDPKLVEGAVNWHRAAQEIAITYDTENRLHKTSLGNPEAYAAGSGPHAHANQEALKDPIEKPLWRNYGRAALIHAMLGRQEAKQVIAIDPDRYREITLATHAAGGSTRRILDEEVVECTDSARDEALRQARQMIDRIFSVTLDVPGGKQVVELQAAEPASHFGGLRLVK